MVCFPKPAYTDLGVASRRWVTSGGQSYSLVLIEASFKIKVKKYPSAYLYNLI